MIEFVFKSEKGLRENQEDFYGNYKDEFFVVADGLGGHAAGEVASKIAVETAISTYKTSRGKGTKKLLEKIGSQVNKAIIEDSRKNPERAGMGTTLVCAAVQSKKVFFGNVGDSRAYLFTDRKLKRKTEDDRDRAGFLIKALGVDEDVKSHITAGSRKKGDLILLCTDGLTDFVSEAVIEKILASNANLKSKAKGLIEASLQFESTDNITVGLIVYS